MLLVAAIIVVLALPQLLSGRRVFAFSGVKREMATHLKEARQAAMSQRKKITFRYDNNRQELTVYGGSYGTLGSKNNIRYLIATQGLTADDVIYGRPAGASTSDLDDGTNLTPLTSGVVEVPFEADGSVLDTSGNPLDTAFFLYHRLHPTDSAFAVSVLGTSGRVKLWRINPSTNEYVE